MSRKMVLSIAVAVLVIVVAGGGFLYYRQAQASPEQAQENPLQTATVRRGSLVISASGTGSLIPSNEVKLSFENSGKLSELLVEVGDEVKAGDVLAILTSSSSDASLTAQLTSAQLNVLKAQENLEEVKASASDLNIAQAAVDLASAQKTLDELLNPAEGAIAEAELAVIAAQEAVDKAQRYVTNLNYDRGSQEAVASARAAYLLAQQKVDQMQSRYEDTGGDPSEDAGKALALSNLAAAKTERDRALATLNWYLGEPTETEINEKHADLALAQGQLADAQEALENLTNPSETDIALAEAHVAALQEQLDTLKTGPDDTDLKLAELDLANAEAQLTLIEESIADQTLVAPIDGTILAVDAQVGDDVGTSAIITMADLSQPMLEIYVDESDLNSIGVGYPIEIVFDALPNDTFNGKITSVDPSLTLLQNVTAVHALAQMDMSTYAKPQTLPVGLNASVEIISSESEDALLVPVEALRELAAGKYGVFVLENDEPVLKVVEVGIMDMTYAEIKSGLNEGDVVTTGIVETGSGQ
ncbi:MAG: efflux RND transporter periplasmic adaptor subunit [Chloroflexota bacterium]